jgi:hypothetical protein
MGTTLRSRHKRAARVTPAVLLGLSLLAACNTDRPVAPENTKASSVKTPSAYWSGAPGAIAFNVVDESQVAVTGYTNFWLFDSKNDSTFIPDNNSYYDSNPASGSYLLKGLTPGSYKVCQHDFPTYYLNANPQCLTANVTTAATTVIGPFVDLHQPKILWKVVDEDDVLLSGAKFTLTNMATNNSALMTDNGPYDGNKTDGLWEMLTWPATLKICETVPPTGYVLPAQPCVTFEAKGGLPLDLGKFVNTLVASVKIEVLSDKFWLIGPSTFKIYGSNTITTVDDNSPFDLYPKYGLLKVKLPAPGTYNVCQTSAPYGFDPPSPPCKGPITVPYGKPTWAPLFIDKPWPVAR